MFNEKYLRDHLVYCLEKDILTYFPRVETKAKLNKKKVNYVDINCDCTICRLPNLMQEMVGCEAGKKKCDVWRHLDCAYSSSTLMLMIGFVRHVEEETKMRETTNCARKKANKQNTKFFLKKNI